MFDFIYSTKYLQHIYYTFNYLSTWLYYSKGYFIYISYIHGLIIWLYKSTYVYYNHIYKFYYHTCLPCFILQNFVQLINKSSNTHEWWPTVAKVLFNVFHMSKGYPSIFDHIIYLFCRFD